MNITAIDPTIWSAVLLVGRVTVLLGLAAALLWLLRRRMSAATSHLVWTIAIGGILLLPLASMVAPSWALVVRTEPRVNRALPAPAAASVPIGAVSSGPGASAQVQPPAGPAPATMSWSVIAVWTYALIAVAMLLRLAVQHATVRRLRRRAAAIADTEWTDLFAQCEADLGVRRSVAFLRSRDLNVPVAFGTRRPSIMVPAMADTWSADRRRAVLRHELAHVARYDCLTQIAAEAACAIYWFHPVVWWAAYRLRIERELACDDRVIAAGTQPRVYAGHLLEIAYSLHGRTAPALAVGMARPRQLEGRMMAALDGARNRAVPSVRVRVAGACAAAGLLLALGGVHPTTVAAATTLDDYELGIVLPETAATGVSGSHTHRHDKPSLRQIVKTSLVEAAAALGVPDQQRPGTWEVQASETPGMVHLRVTEQDSSSSTDVPIAQLEGLTGVKLSTANGPIQFKLRRDAGTFAFDGVVKNGVGAGTFEFTADPAFADGLAKRGFSRPTAREQYKLARADVGYAFLDELTAQGYAKPQTEELVPAGEHGVSSTYLRDMGALGYRLGALDPLITLRDHGITPEYVRELSDLGYKGLAADAIRQSRDHGITPAYVRGMRDAGYGSLSMEQLITARDHGITPEYVRGLGDAGYRTVALDEVIDVRDHGVTPDYVREMRQLGYQLPLADLVELRDHGVDVRYAREMADLGYKNLPAPAILKLRDHGVTPPYVKELASLGYERLSTDDVIMLRDHGVTPDRIRAANAKANTRLPIDMLRSYVDGGGR